MRLGSYSYHEVSPALRRRGVASPDSSDPGAAAAAATVILESSQNSNADHQQQFSGEDSRCCTFSNALQKSVGCVLVKVDQQFWQNSKKVNSPVKDELMAYSDLYLSEHPKFKSLLINSAIAIGEQVNRLGPGLSEVEMHLHRWLIKPIVTRGHFEGIMVGSGCMFPLKNVKGGDIASVRPPKFFAGWTSSYPTIAFTSDCYDQLNTPAAYQHALLTLGQTAAECLLSEQRSINGLVTGLPDFFCFCLCTRNFVQFGSVLKHPTYSSQLNMIPVSRKLWWDNPRDRRRMAELSLGISCWLKRYVA